MFNFIVFISFFIALKGDLDRNSGVFTILFRSVDIIIALVNKIPALDYLILERLLKPDIQSFFLPCVCNLSIFEKPVYNKALVYNKDPARQ